MNDYEPPLVLLPGAKLTPEVLLHRTLNKKERIKAVVVVIQWDDMSFDVDWSSMELRDLSMGLLTLEAHVQRELFK